VQAIEAEIPSRHRDITIHSLLGASLAGYERGAIANKNSEQVDKTCFFII